MYFPPHPPANFFLCPSCGQDPSKTEIPDRGRTGALVDHYLQAHVEKA